MSTYHAIAPNIMSFASATSSVDDPYLTVIATNQRPNEEPKPPPSDLTERDQAVLGPDYVRVSPDWNNKMHRKRMMELIVRVGLSQEHGGLSIENRIFQAGYRNYSDFRRRTMVTLLYFHYQNKDNNYQQFERENFKKCFDKLEAAIIKVGGIEAVMEIRDFIQRQGSNNPFRKTKGGKGVELRLPLDMRFLDM